MKALSKVLIIAHIPLLLLAVILRFTAIDALSQIENDDIFAILAGILLVLFFCYVAVVAFMTEIYFAYYTYKNLFSDQGYLTLTLPATPRQQINAKVLSGTVWILIDQTLILISFLICVAGSHTLSLILNTLEELPKDFILTVFGLDLPTFILYFVLSILIGAVATPCTILGALCIGQLFNKNRVLLSVVAYFLYYFLIQIIASGLLGFRAATANTTTVYIGTKFATDTFPYMKDLLILALISSALFGLLGYFFSTWCMRKKINLH